MTSFLDLDKEKGYSELIERLVEAKSQPIKYLEEDKDKEELKIEVIDDLLKEISSLKKYADQLYGLKSAFKKKKFISTEPSILQGSVRNGGAEGEFKVEIVSLAKKHRIASEPIKSDDYLSPGKFSLIVGDTTNAFDFKGGSIRDLKKIFDRSKKKALEFSLIKRNNKESIAIISSTHPGEKQEILLETDPDGILKQLDFFKKNTPNNLEIWPKRYTPSSTSNIVRGNQLVLSPSSQERVVSRKNRFGRGDMFEFKVVWRHIKHKNGIEGGVDQGATDWGMRFGQQEAIKFDELTFAVDSILPFVHEEVSPSNEQTPVQEIEERIEPLFLTVTGELGKAGKSISRQYYLPKDFSDTPYGSASITVTAEDFFGKDLRSGNGKGNISGELTSLHFNNENTSFELTVSKPLIKKKSSNKKFIPSHEVSPPQNAKLKYKGVEVERDNNTISDLIEGVDLSLKRPSDGEVTFNVDKDREFVFNQLINFIGQFNIYMGKMNMLLSSKPAPQDSEELDKKKYGLFKDELTLKIMRDKLKSITVNPHPTSSPEELALLSQLGITSVFVLGDPDDPDTRKLDLIEDQYNNTYLAKPDLVAELFGYDNSGDLIIDSGVAYGISQLARNYIGSGSAFELKKNTYKRRIRDLERDIEKKQEQLDSYRAEQEKEFAKLNSAQEQMKKMQELIKSSTQ